MSILVRLGRSLGVVRVPRIGDKVWWAPKGVGAVVTARNVNGNIIFQGGPIVRNKKGRETPRWTVAAGVDTYIWHADIGMWVVGQGPLPNSVRGTIITPDPVAVSGTSKGSFAVKVG